MPLDLDDDENARKIWRSAVAEFQEKRTKAKASKRKAATGANGSGGTPIEPIDSTKLFDAVHEFLRRFVVYPSEHAHVAHVLWVAHTHCMAAWESTPRLAFLSPEPASGKTRALEVTELLVPNPVEAINVTPAYLFRKVGDDGAKPTILFDEIDTVFGPKAKENEEIRGLLNAGHRQGAVAGRCVVRGKIVETEEIPAYCAVALAGLGWLPDTILSRSVIVRMRRRKPLERIEPFRRRVHACTGLELRSQLASWAARAIGKLEWPETMPGIEDRDADVWESLIAIADLVGGDWPKRAREAAVALVAASKDAEPSLGLRLLADLKTVFGDAPEMRTAAILKALHELPEAPWADLRGKPLNDHGLAARLRQYEVKSRQLVIGDERPKGYLRADLADAWAIYLPPPDKSATSATSATAPDFQGSKVADVADIERSVARSDGAETADKTAKVADVAEVADVAGDRGQAPAPPPAASDPGPFPEILRRSPPALCDNCGRPATNGQRWHWPGRPDGITLHSSCEGPWFDSEARQ
jgi:hypothetical protein